MDARPITFAAICAAALLTSVAATGAEPADSVVSETKAPVAENDSLFTQLSEFVVEGVEKARAFDPFGHAGFDPSGKIRLTP